MAALDTRQGAAGDVAAPGARFAAGEEVGVGMSWQTRCCIPDGLATVLVVVFAQVLASAMVTWLYWTLVGWGNWGGGVKTHAAASTLAGDVATLGIHDVVVEVDEVSGGLSWACVRDLACFV